MATWKRPFSRHVMSHLVGARGYEAFEVVGDSPRRCRPRTILAGVVHAWIIVLPVTRDVTRTTGKAPVRYVVLRCVGSKPYDIALQLPSARQVGQDLRADHGNALMQGAFPWSPSSPGIHKGSRTEHFFFFFLFFFFLGYRGDVHPLTAKHRQRHRTNLICAGITA